ncbi:MAG: class I SAM-dependent methyltransferase [Planctomycetaceae bacterium]|nr:class I SAM-dependent methyltransferase [Planctomycetaceae bacterium]
MTVKEPLPKPTRLKQRRLFGRMVEHKLMKRVSYKEYRDVVRDKYDGPQGALLTTASLLSLHLPLGDRLFRKRTFDLRGCKSILDVGSGAGQISKHLLKYADPEASVTCFDISFEMLRRARNRIKSSTPRYLVSDMTHLPFADGTFDCITCGYVLEHLPDPRPGLTELARVLAPGGRMLLLATEDSMAGAFTSRMWCCRTYNRRELHRVCEDVGLRWNRELWFTRMHKLLRVGGICVEMVRTHALAA